MKKLRESLVEKDVAPLLSLKSDEIQPGCPFPPSSFENNHKLCDESVIFSHLTRSDFDHLRRIPSIRQKCLEFNEDLVEKAHKFAASLGADCGEFGEDIKERFDQLAADTNAIPTSGDREKRIGTVKALLSKKRRALFERGSKRIEMAI